jgi:transposase
VFRRYRRRVATRYDKTKESYLGFVALASIKLWLPFVHVS